MEIEKGRNAPPFEEFAMPGERVRTIDHTYGVVVKLSRVQGHDVSWVRMEGQAGDPEPFAPWSLSLEVDPPC